MFFVSLVVSIYYNMLNAWAIFYIAASFAGDVPWRNCGNEWNTESKTNSLLDSGYKISHNENNKSTHLSF